MRAKLPPISWRGICENRLENQQRLLNNPLTCGNQPDFYVPLGLVEPKPKEEIRHGCDVSPEEGSRFYQLAETQITKTYNQPNEFFEQVLRQGQSKNSQGRRLAITGEPGAGKTTLCYQIAKWILEQNLGVPILIRLADIGSKPLGEFLLEDWLRHAARKLKAAPLEYSTAFEELLESGDVWLLLDGVDEMAVPSPLAAINRQLAEGWADKVRVVLTCRLNVWDADKNVLRDFDVYRNLDFNDPQVKEFIQKWFADNQQCEGLLQELEKPNQQRINDLVKNPLRLALLCRTWKKGSKLPETKAGLYQRFVEAFYNLKDEFAIEQSQQQQLTQALGELALRALDGEDKDTKTGEVLSRFRLRQCLVDRVFKDRPDLLEWALKLGWLNRVGLASAEEEDSDRAVYAFFHPTFQEYFAALAVDDWRFFLNHVPHNPPQGNYRIFEPQWKQVILLWLGRKNVTSAKKEEFVQALVGFDDKCIGFYQYRSYFLAAVAISEYVECSFTDEIVNQLIKYGFSCSDWEQQERWTVYNHPIAEEARAVLVETHGKAIIALIELLNNSQEHWICMQAVKILGQIGINNLNAINTLIYLLQTTQNSSIRHQTVQSLVQIANNNSKVIAVLTELLRCSQDEENCLFFAWGLGRVDSGNLQAITVLTDLMCNSPRESNRLRAASSLWHIDRGNHNVIEISLDLLINSQGEGTPWLAAEIIKEIGAGSQDVIDTLVKVLRTNNDECIPWQIVGALSRIAPGNSELIEILGSWLHEERSEYDKVWIASNLLEISPAYSEAITTLKYLISPVQDEYIRQLAANKLVRIYPNDSEAIAVLTDLLQTTQENSNLLRLIQEIDEISNVSIELTPQLVTLLDTTKDNNIILNVAVILGRIQPGNWKAISTMIYLLQTSKDLGWQIVRSLKEIPMSDVSPFIVAHLKEYLEQAYKNDFERFWNFYEVMWHCAQNMTYVDFYQAWHNPTSAHPEIQETIVVDSQPSTQRPNLVNLPQLLNTAIANNSNLNDTIHLICIDSSKFENPDNPASEIYAEMVMQGFPERQNGEPETMQALKVYCQLKCQGVFLIFYEDTSGETPQGFSPTFLSSLSKFVNARRICVVSEQPCNLQTFSPTQPNLVADIVSWVREKMMEE
ncbi:HEAT repeat domain-containing protein [Coleofasciculus sp. FACHB-712]|uniref:NACHT C-terminal alpha/beta 1 domain-containing protein n=1 Tax=Coleofasciculus sp. FACHB-712 TaxID=2692789 RepID=UPI001685B89B|nr:NACHT domain-containing protein [Coleofasciculus sp. FACHB-712]MBD1944735.1 HEAT repeat domain-containing protein [Coleofasciculus sp. FACHB-712]